MSRIEAGTKLYVVADDGIRDTETIRVFELTISLGGTKQVRIKPHMAMGFSTQLIVIDDEARKRGHAGPFNNPAVHFTVRGGAPLLHRALQAKARIVAASDDDGEQQPQPSREPARLGTRITDGDGG